ncbi:MAG: hypothetical protein CMK29_07185 [Porticoccaceae bacterium]|nr:hypothetical protein [Porticoccaceae bacterium]
MDRTASFSCCRRYRYALWRAWDKELPSILVFGLNPSTADERVDDATTRKCIGYAKSWGFGELCMVNLFAAVAKRPIELRDMDEPVGPQNDVWLKRVTLKHEVTLAAWGNGGEYLDRAAEVLRFIKPLYCLGKTVCGNPIHPLYQPSSLNLVAL